LHQAGVLTYHCMMHGNMKLKYTYSICVLTYLSLLVIIFNTMRTAHLKRIKRVFVQWQI